MLLCIALPLRAAGLSQFYRPGRNFHSLVGSAFYVVSGCIAVAAIQLHTSISSGPAPEHSGGRCNGLTTLDAHPYLGVKYGFSASL